MDVWLPSCSKFILPVFFSCIRVTDISGNPCSSRFFVLQIPGMRSTNCWRFLGCYASWSSKGWKTRILHGLRHLRIMEALLYNMRFLSRFLDSNEPEEPWLAAEMSTAHGMNHTERWATGDVALPLRSARGWESDWHETRPSFLVIPWKLIPKIYFRYPRYPFFR